MKKTIFIISLFVIASSCNMSSPEMVKQQITRKMEQVKKINDQITALESLIETDSASADEGFIVPVSLKMMDPEPFEHFIEVTGKLEAEEDAFISPEMNGQIKNVYVKEGESVKKGQLLVALNTAMIESSIREVKSGLSLATELYEKQKELRIPRRSVVLLFTKQASGRPASPLLRRGFGGLRRDKTLPVPILLELIPPAWVALRRRAPLRRPAAPRTASSAAGLRSR